MTRKQRIFLAYLAGVVGILSWGVASQRVQVSWGVSDDQLVYSPTPEEITVQLGNIQPVTGALWIGPGTLPDFLEKLGGVKDHLWLETYDFTEKHVKNLFIKLLNNDVNIHLIMENQKYQQFKSTRKEIQSYFSGYSGFEIKGDKQMKTEYVHSKFAVWDRGVLIQTSNLNKSSFVGNREYIFYTENTGIIASLSGIFAKDRTGLPLLKSDIHPNLAVCPINCRGIVEGLIRSARSSIVIQNQYIEDPNVLALIQEKQKDLGTPNVKIQLSKTSTNEQLLPVLGKSLHLFSKPYLHAKMLLIDEKLLLLSSINLSTNSMDNNREMGILLTNPIVIREFIEQFRKDGYLR